jgi:DNA-binding CsgD family transcriptional regulator/PAS domain-containing protein
MDYLPSPILTNVLELISASSEYPDCSLVRQKALDVLFRTISTEGAIFVLPDNNPVSSYVMIKNLDEKFHDYYKTYFHQFDPLQLTQRMFNGNRLNRLEQACGYSYDASQSSEYYTDFLKPQKIHHKLIINLVDERQMYGRIVLMRSQGSGRYSEKEIQLARAISPYLAHALAHNELKKKVKLRGNILNYIEKQSSTGMILLDERLRVIYINQKAEEILGAFEGSEAGGSGKDQILSLLLRDCREIKASLKDSPAGYMAIPRKRTVTGLNNTRFTTSSKAFDQEPGAGNSLLFMVRIEEQPPPLDVNPQHLIDSYHLSKREIDVAGLLFSGLKNAQIADKLFISEITVKKHLQNIYSKVGVNNRTSLVNKMLAC